MNTLIVGMLVAILTGGIVGVERQIRHKTAGLRTNVLVAVGATLYVYLSSVVGEDQTDPTRIIGQVTTGVGFLGVGIIFREGLSIHGLSTAATVWCSAALGCFVGFGYHREAVIGAVMISLINLTLNPISKILQPKKD